MYGLGWYFEELFSNNSSFGIKSGPFFLLVISTIMIAAAGNIINDYFDVRADRINKPEKLIIGKHVKRRVAIITHWAFNVIAFGIAIYLSWIFDTFWYLFIHLLSINVLWLYSSYFKRKFVIGNLLIAALTGMVPLLVGFYFYHHPGLEVIPDIESMYISPFGKVDPKPFIAFLSMGLAFFAFVLNLAREIVKDIEDMEGDYKLKAKTIPIVLGISSAKIISYLLLVAALTGVTFFTIYYLPLLNGIETLLVSALFTLIGIALLISAQSKRSYKRVNTCIKIAMISGTLSPVYWKILQSYVVY
jgi:4-hydroxybenzoate polyprenyltransferase